MTLLDEPKPIAVGIPTLAKMIDVSEATLYARANEGNLPGCRRIGKRLLVHLETFHQYMRSGMGA